MSAKVVVLDSNHRFFGHYNYKGQLYKKEPFTIKQYRLLSDKNLIRNWEYGELPPTINSPPWSYCKIFNLRTNNICSQMKEVEQREDISHKIFGHNYIMFNTPNVFCEGVDFGRFKLQMFLDAPCMTIYHGGSILDGLYNYSVHTHIHVRRHNYINLNSGFKQIGNKQLCLCYGGRYNKAMFRALKENKDINEGIDITLSVLENCGFNDGINLSDFFRHCSIHRCNYLYTKGCDKCKAGLSDAGKDKTKPKG